MDCNIPYSRKLMNERLIGLLESCGLNQKGLAARLGVTPAVVNRLVHGKGDMRISTMDKLCRELSTNPSYLIYGIDKEIVAPYGLDFQI